MVEIAKAAKKTLTLCIVCKNSKIFLGMKKRGFGEGKWNGFGGKVEAGETIEEAAKRELKEEAGITPNDMDQVGVVEFEFKGDPEILQVYIFRLTRFKGKPAESEEMKPRWFSMNKIPFHKMWPDDKHWLPLLLDGKKFEGKFLFLGFDTILDYKLSVLES